MFLFMSRLLRPAHPFHIQVKRTCCPNANRLALVTSPNVPHHFLVMTLFLMLINALSDRLLRVVFRFSKDPFDLHLMLMSKHVKLRLVRKIH